MSFPSTLAIRARRTRRGPPGLLLGAGLLIGGAVLLAPAYLVLRTSESASTAWAEVTRSSTLELLIGTLVLVTSVSVAAVAIAVPAAWLTARANLPWRTAWTVALALPLLFPSYVAAYALIAAAGPRGLLHDVLEPLGVGGLPELYGFGGAWLVLTLITYPYVYLPVRAALLRVDRSLEEAGRSLGKTPLEVFARVTFPALRPSIAAGGLLVALYTLSDFGAVSLLRFDSLTSAVYIQYKSSFDRSSAAALALLLALLALVVVALEGATRGRAAYHARAARRPAAVDLGRWRWPALAFCAAVVTMAVGLPLFVTVYGVVRGVAGTAALELRPASVVNSLSASGMAAAVTLAAALPPAILSARYPGRLSALVERVTYVGFALPGISLALALVFFASNYAPWIYQSLPLLVFAYSVRFLPEAVGASRGALLQVNPATEEVARSLGAGPGKVFARVTAPQMLPGMTAGALLVFLTTMKELPITLLLSPIGFQTLATDIWSATTEGFFARAAAPSLVLVLLSAVTVFIVLRRERALG